MRWWIWGLLIGGTLAVGLWLSRMGWLAAPVPAPVEAKRPKLIWVFEAPFSGGFVATPTLDEHSVYVAGLQARGFRYSGIVFALDKTTGQKRWSFTDDGQMKASASRVLAHGERLYFGEGMHGDFVCHFRCLDRRTGQLIWMQETQDHLEASPTIHDGMVYSSSGNDGLHAWDAMTGEPRWHFTADIHTDAQPCIADDSVFIGTGPSRRYPTKQVIALNRTTGAPRWRIPVDLPAWGSPVARNQRLFVGLGNGRMMTKAQPLEVPAGALLCLDTRTGQELWRVKCAEAVFQQPTLYGENVYCISRDGLLRAIQQESGRILYERFVGEPVIASPTIANNVIYTLSVPGLLKASRLADGEPLWEYDIAATTETEPLCFGAAQVEGHRLYLACELGSKAGNIPAVYCLELPE